MDLKNYELAYKDYKAGMTYNQIAQKHNVSLSAVRAWQQRYWRKMNDIQPVDDTQINTHKDIQVKIDVAHPLETMRAVASKQVEDTRPEALTACCDIDYWSKLNERQQRFVQEYLVDCNGQAAAIRCGYSPDRAHVTANDLKANINVAACIAKAEAERSRRTGLNAELIDIELARILRVNPIHVINMATGEIRDDATDDDLATIQSVKVKPVIDKFGNVHYEREVRFVPKDKAIEMAMRRHNMITDRKQVDIHTTVELMSSEDREREIKKLLAKRDVIDI